MIPFLVQVTIISKLFNVKYSILYYVSNYLRSQYVDVLYNVSCCIKGPFL